MTGAAEGGAEHGRTDAEGGVEQRQAIHVVQDAATAVGEPVACAVHAAGPSSGPSFFLFSVKRHAMLAPSVPDSQSAR